MPKRKDNAIGTNLIPILNNWLFTPTRDGRLIFTGILDNKFDKAYHGKKVSFYPARLSPNKDSIYYMDDKGTEFLVKLGHPCRYQEKIHD